MATMAAILAVAVTLTVMAAVVTDMVASVVMEETAVAVCISNGYQ